MKISNDVSNVLANSRIDGSKLFLPEGQLDRKLYVAVNKVLIAIKGKWNRLAKAHVFSDSPAETIENILLTGEYTDEKKEFQFFETPTPLAQKLVAMAEIMNGETVCEPSAGRGRIAEQLPAEATTCFELNDSNRNFLEGELFNVGGGDFLQNRKMFDVFVANPPFTKQQDIDHVDHMISLATRRVVSVMSASVLFRDNKKTVSFRNMIDGLGGTIEPLPDNSFAESGTKVNTCVVCVDI